MSCSSPSGSASQQLFGGTAGRAAGLPCSQSRETVGLPSRRLRACWSLDFSVRRYHAVLFPITTCICELLEEGQRESSCMDLCFEDLEKLHPDEVARICEWLTEKVDGFSSKIKPEAKDIEEEVRPGRTPARAAWLPTQPLVVGCQVLHASRGLALCRRTRRRASEMWTCSRSRRTRSTSSSMPSGCSISR